jgi:hypothetical protein
MPGYSLQKKNRQQRTNIYCNIQLIELMNELIVRVLLLPSCSLDEPEAEG